MAGWRFRKRVRIGPGLAINLMKTGVSVSVGPQGAHTTIGTNGISKSFSIRGTGLYYMAREKWNKNVRQMPKPEDESSTFYGLCVLIIIIALCLGGWRVFIPAFEFCLRVLTWLWVMFFKWIAHKIIGG